MKLSILLPTYNRAFFLLKNLELLANFIRSTNLINEFEIVVSNNKSTDDTDNKIKYFTSNNKDINFQYFNQKDNIGLEKNALFVLKQAKGLFIMFLGDDDYIHKDYLINFLDSIKNNDNIRAFIPSIIPIDVNGNILSGGRDLKRKRLKSAFGFKNCLINSWRGHQLSGLIFKTEGLLKSYIEKSVSNIYPFIYFTGYSCLKGDCLHVTDLPVKVTSVNQSMKDWGYGSDGLLNDIFDNYQKLPISELKKSILQLYFIHKQSWRLTNFRKKDKKFFLKAIIDVWLSDKTNIYFKFFFPLVLLITLILNRLRLF